MLRGEPDYPYINPLRIHGSPFIPTDRESQTTFGRPCPYRVCLNVVRLRRIVGVRPKKVSGSGATPTTRGLVVSGCCRQPLAGSQATFGRPDYP